MLLTVSCQLNIHLLFLQQLAVELLLSYFIFYQVMLLWLKTTKLSLTANPVLVKILKWTHAGNTALFNWDPSTCENPEMNPCTMENIRKRKFFHEYCADARNFIQCDEFGGWFVMPCPVKTEWRQAHLPFISTIIYGLDGSKIR